MSTLYQRSVDLLRDETGQDLIEYALLGAFIGLSAIGSFRTLANAVKNVFANIGTTLTSST